MSSLLYLKKLANESLVYGISGIVSRFLNIFLVPIYTRIFAPAEYGVVSLVINTFALMNILVILGLDSSAGRWFYDSEDKAERKKTLNSFLWSCLGTACLFSVIIGTFRNFIAQEILREPATAPVLLIAAVNLPLSIFNVFTWNLLRLQRRAVMTTVFTLTTSLITIGLNLLFVVWLRWGIAGIFYAQICASVISAIWTLILFRNYISPFYFGWQRWKEMILFSLPLVPGSVCFWVVNLSGAYFLQIMNNPAEVGLYYIGSASASGIVLLTGAFQMAWGPFAYSISNEPNHKKVYADVLLIYLAATCTAGVFITLFAHEILTVFTTEQYVDAMWVVGILSYNYIVIGLSYIASIGTGLAKNNYAYGISMVISAVVLVALNLILVPIYGKEGAAFSTLISQSIVPIAIFWHAQKLYLIPYNWKKAISIFFVGIIISFGGLLFIEFYFSQPVIVVGLKFLIVTAFCCFLIYFLKLKDKLKFSPMNYLRKSQEMN